MYEVIFSKQAAKFISELEKGYREKIKSIIMVLMDNPYGYPYKKIKGETGLYRVRVGRYRILYEVDKKNNRVIILKIDDRGRIYKSI